VPAPHARDLALGELMKVNQLQHQHRFRVLRREGALNGLAQQVEERLFAGRFLGLWPPIEKVVGRIRRRGDFYAKSLPPFQVDQTMGRHGEEPGFERTASLVLGEERRPVLFRGETIGPKVGHQIFRFGLVRAPGTQDSHELPMIAAAQLGGRRCVHREHALDEGEILLMTRSCFDRHREKENGVLPFSRQLILTRDAD
jgi:hypothetical protein